LGLISFITKKSAPFMQQILLVLNPLSLNISSIDFAAYIANSTRSCIVGMFLNNEKLYSSLSKSTYESKEEEETAANYSSVSNGFAEENLQLFKDICTRHHVGCSIHYAKGVAVDEVIKESRFSDLIIIDGETSLPSDKIGEIPSRFVRDILTASECPVIISPLKFDKINEVIFTYDGSKSSMFAIKQFTYLFPSLDETKITLVQITPNEVNELTENDNLKKWLMMHYSAVHLEILHGAADAELFKKLVATRNKLLVMGAYGRRMLLSHSTADIVLKNIDIPVFIAHQ
jgi:hypothetical protein